MLSSSPFSPGAKTPGLHPLIHRHLGLDVRTVVHLLTRLHVESYLPRASLRLDRQRRRSRTVLLVQPSQRGVDPIAEMRRLLEEEGQDQRRGDGLLHLKTPGACSGGAMKKRTVKKLGRAKETVRSLKEADPLLLQVVLRG
jgi:hypothetical protein